MRLSKILKEYREVNDLSQREFARMCGLSNSLISILEMGVNPQTGKEMEPDMRTYRRLADGMGITVQELFDRIKADVHLGPSGLSNTDLERLEALHRNPQLGLLFDRTSKMKPEDVAFMIQMTDRMLKTQNGDA